MTRSSLAVLLLVFLVCACAQFPYREKGLDPVAADCSTALYSEYSDGQKIGDAVLEGPKADCWKRSLEEHRRYDLMFIEFDDQGWVQRSSNLPRPSEDYFDQFFAQLEKIRARYAAAGRALSLVVYTHGWHHNAHANDKNVRDFRKLLGDVALAEGESGTSRRVVGIYIGWRGDSLTSSWINWITFWDRKNTAERVSQGMVREFFSRLDHFRDRAEKRSDKVNRMLVIGHSFGGLITYQSLSGEFLRAAARYQGENGSAPCAQSKARYLTRFGDLVVIVNPAFEGTRYEPLKISGQRLRCLNEAQLPIVIIATSQADRATKNAFPIARWFSTIFEWAPDEEQKANVRTVGHNPRYTTHNLVLCAKDDAACAAVCQRIPAAPERRQTKDFEQLVFTIEERKETIAQEQKRMAAIEQRGFAPKEYFCGGEGETFNLQLTTAEQWHPQANPFWVVHTTGDIMTGHNDIFNPRFVAFIRQMYIRTITATEKAGRQLP